MIQTYLSLAESNDAIFMSDIQDIDTLIETTPEIEVELKHVFDSLLKKCACSSSGSYEYTTVIEANNTNGKNNGDVSLDHSPRFAEVRTTNDVEAGDSVSEHDLDKEDSDKENDHPEVSATEKN